MINPTDSYLIVNDISKVTHHHIIHFKRNDKYYFSFAENLRIGDELMNSSGKYETVKTVSCVKENINVYNFK